MNISELLRTIKPTVIDWVDARVNASTDETVPVSTTTVIVQGGGSSTSPVPFGVPTVTLGTAAVEGSSPNAIRTDATITAFDATVPATLTVSTSSAAGAAAYAARRDHTHAITSSSNPGAAASLLATNASGQASVQTMGVGTAIPALGSPGVSPSSTSGSLFLSDNMHIYNSSGAGQYFRIDGWQNALYIVVEGGGNPSAATSLIVRTAPANAHYWNGAVDRLTIDGSGNVTLNTTTGAFGWSDVSLSRGAANRLDLATGDSLNLVAGNVLLATGQYVGLSGAGRIEFNDAATDVLHIHSANVELDDANTLGWGDVVLSHKAANVLALASGDSWQSTTYAAGAQGWQVAADGTAEFSNVRIRGELSSATFKYDEITSTAGTFGVWKSASTLVNDCTTVTTPTTFYLDAKKSDAGGSLFAVNDILRLKSWTGAAVLDNWCLVTVVDNTPSTYTRYTCTKPSGTNGTFRAGTTVVDYGPSGQGYLLLSADGTNAPWLSIRTHAGAPYTTEVERVRMGNLNGSYGQTTDVYGFGAGQYVVGKSSVVVTDAGLSLYNGTTERIGLTAAGVLTIKNSSGNDVFSFNSSAGAEFTLPLTLGTGGGIYQGSGTFASPTTGLKLWNDSGTGRLAGYNTSAMQWSAGTDGRIYAGYVSSTPHTAIGASGIVFDGNSTSPITQDGVTWRTTLPDSGNLVSALRAGLYTSPLNFPTVHLEANPSNAYSRSTVLVSAYGSIADNTSYLNAQVGDLYGGISLYSKFATGSTAQLTVASNPTTYYGDGSFIVAAIGGTNILSVYDDQVTVATGLTMSASHAIPAPPTGCIRMTSGAWIGLDYLTGRMEFNAANPTSNLHIHSAHVTVDGGGLNMGSATNAGIGEIHLPSSGYVGLGAAAGRLVFTDAATDTLAVMGAYFGVGITPVHALHIATAATTYGLIDSYTNATEGAHFSLRHSRNGTIGSHTILQDGDRVGVVQFQGSDGANWINAGYIDCLVDGTPGTNDMPGRLVFFTTADGASSATERARIDSAGRVTIGGVTAADEATGPSLTINQGSWDEDILSLQSSDVAHGMTTHADTDTFGSFRKYSATAGGLTVWGLTEDQIAFAIGAFATNGDTTHSTAAVGAVTINSTKKSSTTVGAMATNENLFVIRNNGTTAFIVDADGDVHYDGTSTHWPDDRDDTLALHDLRQAVVPARRQRDAASIARLESLERAGIVSLTRDQDGEIVEIFESLKGGQALVRGALWQMYQRIQTLESQLATLTHN